MKICILSKSMTPGDDDTVAYRSCCQRIALTVIQTRLCFRYSAILPNTVEIFNRYEFIGILMPACCHQRYSTRTWLNLKNSTKSNVMLNLNLEFFFFEKKRQKGQLDDSVLLSTTNVIFKIYGHWFGIFRFFDLMGRHCASEQMPFFSILIKYLVDDFNHYMLA